MELDLRGDLVLTLAFDARGVFGASHRIDIAAADSTHSKDDGGLAERLADNAVRGFSVLKLEPDLSKPAEMVRPNSKVPALLAGKVPAHFPEAAWPVDNPLTEAGVELGRMLFHDVRLSVNGTQSCASCHLAEHAFSDPRRFSLGAEGQIGTRNAMPLSNLAWKPAFFWDGRAPTLRARCCGRSRIRSRCTRSLDRVVAQNRRDRIPAALRGGLRRRRRSPPTGLGPRAGAVSPHAHLRHDAKIDRAVRGRRALTDDEQRGFELFFTEYDPRAGQRGADCFHCHGGALFTDHQFHNNGLDGRDVTDFGLARVTGKLGRPRRNSPRPACATSPSPRPTCTTAASPRSRKSSTTTTTASKQRHARPEPRQAPEHGGWA